MPLYDIQNSRLSHRPEDERRNALLDIGVGAVHGVAALGKSLYGLADTISFDYLPDWEKNPVPKPDTFVGGLASAGVQFFIPFGAVGKVASVAAKAGKGGRFAGFLAGKTGNPLAKIAPSVNSARPLSSVNKAIMAGTETLGRGAAKGALVDFIAFEGHEERLSDLVQTVPALANPLTEFLASDESDTEVEGRLKNVLEGALLGGAIDSLFAWRRGAKAAKVAKDAGKSVDEQASAYKDAVADGIDERARLRQTEEEAILKQEADRVFETTDAEGNLLTMTGAELDAAAKADLDEALANPELQEAMRAMLKDEESLGRTKVAREGLTDDEVLRRKRKDTEKGRGNSRNLKDKQRLNSEDVDYRDLENAQRVGGSLESLSDEALNVNPRKISAEERIRKNLKFTDQNLRMFLSDKSAGVRLRRAVEQADLGFLKRTTQNKADLAKALEDGMRFGGLTSGEQRSVVADLAGKDIEQLQEIAGRSLMMRVVSEKIAADVLPQVRELASSPSLTLDDTKVIANSVKLFVELQNGITGVASEIGRALQQTSIKLDPKRINKRLEDLTFSPLDAMVNLTDETFDPTKIKILVDDMLDTLQSPNPLENIAAMAEWDAMPVWKKVLHGTQEYHINALLSGPPTHIINAVSGVAMTFARPIEQIISAGIGRTFGDISGAEFHKIMSVETKTVLNLLSGFGETARMLRQSGTPVDAFASASKLDQNTFSGLSHAAGGSSLWEPIVRTVQLPSWALQKGDSFIKTWNGRARARAVLFNETLSSGMDVAEATVRTEEILNTVLKSQGDLRGQLALAKAMREAGAENAPVQLSIDRSQELLDFTDDELDAAVEAHMQGLLAGKEATFTQELGEDAFGKIGAAANMLNKIPIMRFFLPFVRTPLNIAQYGWDRTIGSVMGGAAEAIHQGRKVLGIETPRSLEAMTKIQRQLADPDPAIRAQARARMTYGIAVVTGITTAVSQPTDENGLPYITGSGPSDPDVLATLKASGWQPFSIKVGDTYVSYARLDPFASLIGTVVDAGEYIRENDDGDGMTDAASSWMMGLAAGVANNISSKTYAQGLSNVIDLFSDPDANAERVLGGVAGSFVPAVVGGVERTVDPTLQEVRGVVDRLQSRIPGLSAGLSPRRDLLGEPIKIYGSNFELLNPLRVSKVKDSVVEKELSRFAYGFSSPTTTKQGVDLLADEYRTDKGQEAYDRYLELAGSHKVRGMNLRQALRREIKSAEYQRLSPDLGPNDEQSPRIARLQSIIRRHRGAAWKQVLREIPSLKSAVNETKQIREARRAGRDPLTL